MPDYITITLIKREVSSLHTGQLTTHLQAFTSHQTSWQQTMDSGDGFPRVLHGNRWRGQHRLQHFTCRNHRVVAAARRHNSPLWVKLQRSRSRVVPYGFAGQDFPVLQIRWRTHGKQWAGGMYFMRWLDRMFMAWNRRSQPEPLCWFLMVRGRIWRSYNSCWVVDMKRECGQNLEQSTASNSCFAINYG